MSEHSQEAFNFYKHHYQMRNREETITHLQFCRVEIIRIIHFYFFYIKNIKISEETAKEISNNILEILDKDAKNHAFQPVDSNFSFNSLNLEHFNHGPQLLNPLQFFQKTNLQILYSLIGSNLCKDVNIDQTKESSLKDDKSDSNNCESDPNLLDQIPSNVLAERIDELLGLNKKQKAKQSKQKEVIFVPDYSREQSFNHPQFILIKQSDSPHPYYEEGSDSNFSFAQFKRQQYRARRYPRRTTKFINYNSDRHANQFQTHKSKLIKGAAERRRKPDNPDMEAILSKWVLKTLKSGVRLTQKDIRTEAIQIMEKMGHNYFRASKGWVEKFFRRNPDIFSLMHHKKKSKTESQTSQ